MSLLRDDVKLTDIVMPGSHNSGCRKMIPLANCQDGDCAEQFRFGVRFFDIRLNSRRITHTVVHSHSVINGRPFEEDLIGLAKELDAHPGEFCVFTLAEYGDEKFGPYTHRCILDYKKADELLEKYIQPSKYALTDFDDINDVTIGDVRRSGKRFILINDKKAFAYSVACPFDSPWSGERHGLCAEKFVVEQPKVFDNCEKKGFFVLQTQQTAAPGSEVGLASPRNVNKAFRPYYHRIIDTVRETPAYLEKVNIILSDYMTEDTFKADMIIGLNEAKGNFVK